MAVSHPAPEHASEARPPVAAAARAPAAEGLHLAGAKIALDRVSCRFGAREVVRDVSLSVAPGEVVALLGASGCGKSTTLRIAAGVQRQTSGQVFLDGVEVAGPGRFVPPEARNVGLVFQDYALFPHMSVFDNVAFGLNGMARSDRGARVMEALERVHMAEFARKFPAPLSGGEQQRVALARALAPRPDVMLMDEPFSGLDVPRRDRIRDETWALLKESGTATLLVTHDPKEAMRMADRIALMRAGEIVQVGTPQAIYTAPVDSRAAAFFSDLNIFVGQVRQGRVETPFGLKQTPDLADGAAVEILVRPHAIRLVQDTGVAIKVRRSVLLGPESLIEGVLEAATTGGEARHLGDRVVRVTVPAIELPSPGEVVKAHVDEKDILVFPVQQG